MTVQVFEEVVQHGREGCGVFIGSASVQIGVWFLAAWKIPLMQKECCGIPVHIPNIKSCLQNFKATIKDIIIFHLQNKSLLHLAR